MSSPHYRHHHEFQGMRRKNFEVNLFFLCDFYQRVSKLCYTGYVLLQVTDKRLGTSEGTSAEISDECFRYTSCFDGGHELSKS